MRTIRIKSTKKDVLGPESNFTVFLGRFDAVEKKTPIPGHSFVLDLSQKKAKGSSCEALHSLPSPYQRYFFSSVSKIISVLLICFALGKSLVLVYADELPLAFPDLMEQQASAEINTDKEALLISETPMVDTESSVEDITALGSEQTLTEISDTLASTTESSLELGGVSSTTISSENNQEGLLVSDTSTTSLEAVLSAGEEQIIIAEDAMISSNTISTSTEEITTSDETAMASSTEEAVIEEVLLDEEPASGPFSEEVNTAIEPVVFGDPPTEEPQVLSFDKESAIIPDEEY